MSKYSSYYSDDYDGPDMSEDEIHPYEGPDVACKECDREYPCGTHEAAKEELCPFCKGEATCLNDGCDAQARVFDKEDGNLKANYCGPCWTELCDGDEEGMEQFALRLDPQQHVPF